MAGSAAEPITPYRLSDDRRNYVCARCGKQITDGARVVGAEKSGKLVGVSAWAEGTLRDGSQGLVKVHGCGDSLAMPEDVQFHHDTLRGVAAPNTGVSEV